MGYNHRPCSKHCSNRWADWYLGALAKGGYPLIALLMAIESSIVPLPSELVIPPAAHLAHTHQIPIGLTGIIIGGHDRFVARSNADVLGVTAWRGVRW